MIREKVRAASSLIRLQQHVVEGHDRCCQVVEFIEELIRVGAMDDPIGEVRIPDIADLQGVVDVHETIGHVEGRCLADLEAPEIGQGEVVEIVFTTTGEGHSVLATIANQQIGRIDAVITTQDPSRAAVSDTHVVQLQLGRTRWLGWQERPRFALDPDQSVLDHHVIERVVIGPWSLIDPYAVPLAGHLVIERLKAISLEYNRLVNGKLVTHSDPPISIDPKPTAAMEVDLNTGFDRK